MRKFIPPRSAVPPGGRLLRNQKAFGVANEFFDLSVERVNFSLCVVHVVRRISQCAAAIISPVKRQIIGAKEVVAAMIDHIIAVAAYPQALLIEGILLPEREGQIGTDRTSDVQRACYKGGLDSLGKFQMKVVRKREGFSETKVDGPTVIDEICALAALKPHSGLIL